MPKYLYTSTDICCTIVTKAPLVRRYILCYYRSRHTNSGIIYTRIGVIFARFFTFLRTYRSLMFWFFLNYHGVGSTLIPELM